jgi:hypothetical protein
VRRERSARDAIDLAGLPLGDVRGVPDEQIDHRRRINGTGDLDYRRFLPFA